MGFERLAALLLIPTVLAGGSEHGTVTRQQATIQAIVNLFDRTPVVAIGEIHGSNEQHAFLRALIADPAFGRNVSNIVVEFGNAKYQAVADAFVMNKRAVSDAELRLIWRNTTQSGLIQPGLMNVWDAPIYEQFFRAVRAANQARPPGQAALRVILGDPPIDWAAVKKATDMLSPFLTDRDGYYAHAVESEVLDKGQRALLITGVYHVSRLSPPSSRSFGTAIEQVEAKHPGTVSVLLTYYGFPRSLQADAQRLAELPTPYLLMLANTWPGQLSADTVFSDFRWDINLGQKPLNSVVDGLLLLGDPNTFTESLPDPAIYREPQYAAELRRRQQLIGVGDGNRWP